MPDNVLDFLMASPSLREAFRAPEKGVLALYDMAEGQRPFYAAALARTTGRQVLFIAPSDSAAMRAADDCAAWLQGGAEVLPAPEINFTRGVASRENAFRRLAVLERVRTGNVRVLCVPADAVLTRMPPREQYEKLTLRVRPGEETDPAALIAALVKMGYERVDMVEGRGQCALRGAIVDAFSPAEAAAVRMEFFDTEVDSIRSFDPISQRSLDRLEEAVFCPAVEWTADECNAPKMRDMIHAQAARVQSSPLLADLPPLPESEEGEADAAPAFRVYDTGVSRLLQDADQLESGLQPPTIALWAGALNLPCAWVWDYMENPIILIDDPERVKARCTDRVSGFQEDFRLALERQEAVPEQGALLRSWEEAAQALQGLPVCTMQDFLRGMGEMKPGEIVQFPGVNAPKYVSRFKDLAGDLQNWKKENYLTLLMAGGEARARRLQSALAALDAPVFPMEEAAAHPESAAILCPMTLSRGFNLPEARIAVVADSDIFGAGYRKTRARKTSGERIEAFTDLKEGDYVVHEAHGVGIFRGTVRIQSEGTYRDYLLIQYQGSDKLYVPTDQFDRVQKFIGSPDSPPPLNSLNGSDWERQKKKVRAGLKKLAFDLVARHTLAAAV